MDLISRAKGILRHKYEADIAGKHYLGLRVTAPGRRGNPVN